MLVLNNDLAWITQAYAITLSGWINAHGLFFLNRQALKHRIDNDQMIHE